MESERYTDEGLPKVVRNIAEIMDRDYKAGALLNEETGEFAMSMMEKIYKENPIYF